MSVSSVEQLLLCRHSVGGLRADQAKLKQRVADMQAQVDLQLTRIKVRIYIHVIQFNDVLDRFYIL